MDDPVEITVATSSREGVSTPNGDATTTTANEADRVVLRGGLMRGGRIQRGTRRFSSSRAGRKMSQNVRALVKIEESSDGSGRTIQTCSVNNCSHQRQTKEFPATKWAKHFLFDCKNIDVSKKKEIMLEHPEILRQATFNPISTCNDNNNSFTFSQNNSNTSSHNPTKKQKLFDRFDHCDSLRTEKINMVITEFIVACALPFNIVNTEVFRTMIKKLNSAYFVHLPKSEAFRRRFLPACYTNTKNNIDEMWKTLQAPHKTLGFDGFTNNLGDSIVNFVESTSDKTAFVQCVDPGERREDAKFYAHEIEKQLLQGSSKVNMPVEDVYDGVIGDNVSYNQAAFKILEQKYPKLFYLGCTAHCFDLLIEDVAKIQEFKEVVSTAKSITKFVRDHRHVKAAFKRIIGRDGLMLVTYPDTRFCYADLMLYRCFKNRNNLDSLLEDREWTSFTKGIKISKVEKFKQDVTEGNWGKMRCLHDLLSCITKATHHIEGGSARASWISPLCGLMIHTFQEWSIDQRTSRHFSDSTIKLATKCMTDRWLGLGSKQVGLKRPYHLMANILDPFTCLPIQHVPINYETECRYIIKKFYSNSEDIENAFEELQLLLRRVGTWGEILKQRQECLNPPDDMKFEGLIDKLIWKQKK